MPFSSSSFKLVQNALFSWLWLATIHESRAFQELSVTSYKRHNLPLTLCHATESNPQNEEDLLTKAAQLRKEAQDLESKLRASAPSRVPVTGAPSFAPPVYKDVKDSAWTISYRFATRPDDDESSPAPKYGGKLKLLLKSDGYTDFISHEPSVPTKALDIVKAWGWDLEKSAEDEKEYVLFSVDVKIPEDGRKERFYFQARQDKDSDGAIELKEGTVTFKQDVTETKDGGPSFWGLLSPKGILARFTYVGDFVARPAQKSQ